jgi:putrescine aminotransferase
MLATFKDHPLVGEVRSIGLLGAIELVADKRSRGRFADLGRVGLICRDHFFREGFIMRAVFDTMVMAPPLIWEQEQFDEAEGVIRRVLDLTLDDVAGEVAA